VPFDYCHQDFEWKAPPLIAFNTPPDSDWISAGEAIAWIAFRHALRAEHWDKLPAWEPQQQWPSYDREFEGLLEARAKRTPWRPAAHSIFGPDHWRAQLRAVERKSGLSATALLPIFHQDRARHRIVDATLKAAGRALVSAVAAGAIPAFGRRQREFAVDDPKASLTEIPPEILAQPVTIEPAGFIGWDTRGVVFRGPFFGDIRFRTTDIATIWPPARVDDAPRPPARLEDLPASWTLLETLAWIVFRDPSIVRDASLETPREATEYWEQVQTGGGNTVLALVQGEPGISRLRLTLMRVARGTADQAPDEPTTGQAETDLLTRLRAGDIAATGIAFGDKSRTTIQPEDWRGLRLTDDRFNSRIVIATPAAGDGGTWHSVLLPKDRLLELWPANHAKLSSTGEPDDPALGRSLEQASISTMPAWLSAMETLAWIVTRSPKVVWLANLEHPRTRSLIEAYDLPRHRGINRLWLALHYAADQEGDEVGDGSVFRACRDIVEAAQRGQLRARATWSRKAERKDWDADDWRGVTLEDVGVGGATLAPCRRLTGGGLAVWSLHDWADLRLAWDDVVKVWPARHTEDAEKTAPIAEIVGPMRPKPTEAEVRRWFADRVANWPDDLPAPSEKMDWEAASRHFGDGLRRDQDFRPIRESATPLEWRKQGRRPPWGKVRNSAPNSAKLRRQN